MVEKSELRAQAEQGDSNAQFALGEMHWQEQGNKWSPETDNEEAIQWLRKAAEQGHAGAAIRISDYFVGELGDESEGVKWYRRAIEAGHPHCGDALGIAVPFYSGFSIWGERAVSPKEKIPRERTLAKGGDPDAQYRLGALFANGVGVSLDLVQAYAWFVVAARPELNQSITSTSQHRTIQDWGTPARAVRVLEQVMVENELELAKSLASDYLTRFGGRISVEVKLFHFGEICVTWFLAIAVVLPVLIFRGIWGRFFPPKTQL